MKRLRAAFRKEKMRTVKEIGAEKNRGGGKGGESGRNGWAAVEGALTAAERVCGEPMEQTNWKKGGRPKREKRKRQVFA